MIEYVNNLACIYDQIWMLAFIPVGPNKGGKSEWTFVVQSESLANETNVKRAKPRGAQPKTTKPRRARSKAVSDLLPSLANVPASELREVMLWLTGNRCENGVAVKEPKLLVARRKLKEGVKVKVPQPAPIKKKLMGFSQRGKSVAYKSTRVVKESQPLWKIAFHKRERLNAIARENQDMANAEEVVVEELPKPCPIKIAMRRYRARINSFFGKLDKITYIRYVFIFATDMKKLQTPFTELPTPLRVQYKSYKNSSYFLTVDNDEEKLFYAYPGKWELAVKARRRSYTLMLGWWSFVFNNVLQRYYGVEDQMQVPLLNIHFNNLNNRILKYFFFVQDVSTYWPNTHIVITIDYNLYQFIYIEKKSRYMKKYKLKNRYGADRAFRRDNWAPIVF